MLGWKCSTWNNLPDVAGSSGQDMLDLQQKCAIVTAMMTFDKYCSREQVAVRRAELAAMLEAKELVGKLEGSFDSYRSQGARVLRSVRLRLLGEINSARWSLDNGGRMSGE